MTKMHDISDMLIKGKKFPIYKLAFRNYGGKTNYLNNIIVQYKAN